MSEYIINVPDRYDVCFKCQRDTCIEVGCEHARLVNTARHREEIVRCHDCKSIRDKHPDGIRLQNHKKWCVRLCRAVDENGFCYRGDRKSNGMV